MCVEILTFSKTLNFMIISSNIKAIFPYNLRIVWQVVTSLTNYSWRNDIQKIEVISDTQFIEITKGGCRTVFTITKEEPYCLLEFDMENKNMKGHWIGIFGGNEKRATIDFTEYIEPKKWFMTPFVKMYLKYWQVKYVRELRNVLKSVSVGCSLV